MNEQTQTIPDICEITTFSCSPDLPIRLLIELPHGATKAKHFENYRQQLLGTTFPQDLAHFFFVNTDVGTPELGMQIAKQFASNTTFGAVVIKSLIPRTFIDCNRVIALSADDYKKGGVTPGIPPYVTNQTDLQFLTEQYTKYQKQAQILYEDICQIGGFALMLHSYAPKTVGIATIDDQIVKNLHRVYQPDLYKTWPTRPEIDFITTTLENQRLAPGKLIDQMSTLLREDGFEVEEGKSYPLHPSTTAFSHASSYPDNTLCMEVRRDLLATEFTPFSEMNICQQKVERISVPVSKALSQWLINHQSNAGFSISKQNIME